MKKLKELLIKDKFLYMIIGGILINAFCFMLFYLDGHCASEEPIAYELPYNFYVFDANNTYCVTYNEDFILAGINWNSDIAGYNWDNYIAVPIEVYTNYNEVEVRYFFNPSIEYDVPEDINFFNTGITITYDNFVGFTIDYYSENEPVHFHSWGSGGSGTITVCGSFLPNDQYNGYSIQRFYPYYSTDDLYDTNGDLIFGYITSPVINNGHATPPGIHQNPYFNPNSHAQPPQEVPPQITINNYTWTTPTPPAFDDTGIIEGLESLGNIFNYLIGWLLENIVGLVQNAMGNIKALFEYIGENIQYYGGLIISNIQNLIDTFYNNMVSLVEPIAENIGQTKEEITDIKEFFTKPLDTQELDEQLGNSSFVTAYNGIKTEITDFFGQFSDIDEPQTIVWEIDLTDLWFNGGVSYLDFSIIAPVLPFIRLVLGCILIYELIVTIVTNINTYIGGNSAKNDG